MSGAYYNEIDPFAAAWLRELIKGGHVAAGEVDTRSIEDVRPDDLRGFEQCHFFAGIGGWSLALRRAGWPDDRPVWTGSCPCQPFSTAGQGAGFDDERHLWPSFYWLIQERHPPVVAGEQVASKDADSWLDLVQDDLEALGYAFGAVAFPSAGVGAPHIRDRTYWMAYAHSEQPERPAKGAKSRRGTLLKHGECLERLAQYDGNGCGTPALAGIYDPEHHPKSCGGLVGLADAELSRTTRHGRNSRPSQAQAGLRDGLADSGIPGAPGPTNGLWRDADWLFCRDGKWRPVEPGTFPLAHGVPARMGRLRGYGNAINAEQAALFAEVMQELV